ncbi:hypothetical protein HY061_02415 [Candidatus Azambacteria bacterium]|nr:hypothetical protein [Candidatus Azambacteria bacterium]
MKNDNEGSKKMVYLNWFEAILVLITLATIACVEIVAILEISIYKKNLIASINSIMWTLVFVISHLDKRRLRELELEGEIDKKAQRFLLVLAISSIITGWNYIQINLWINAAVFVGMFVAVTANIFKDRERTSPAITPPMDP